jgi:hypothetical protein
MTDSKIQIRGNCQCCGRQQAVVGGGMSKHGYTVDHGWFSGVCSGERYAPMQVSRTHTDEIIVDVLADVVALLAKADKVKAGEITPKTIIRSPRFQKIEIAFADAEKHEQANAVQAMEWNLRNRARAGEQFAKALGEVADKVHGTALIEVAKKEAPEFIGVGHQKAGEGIVYTCVSVQGGRVYWKGQKGDKTFKGWMGCQAWRKFPTI